MSTDLAVQKKPAPPAREFRNSVTRIAGAVLSDWVGEERAKEAVGRVSVALSSVAASAKNPQDFYDCTPQSIAAVVAISALTSIMPGTGAGALAYAIPRRARKGEQPQLRYQLSHRGLNALASRAGCTMVPVPISYTDEISVDECGEVLIRSIDLDNPPLKEEELRGVVLTVKNNRTGAVLQRQWVPKKTILEHRESSDSYQFARKTDWAKASDPWHKWFNPMACKTAMHIAVARGWCVIDDTDAMRAIAMDVESDIAALPAPEGHKASRLDMLADALGGEEGGEDHEVTEETEGDSAVDTEIISKFAPGSDEKNLAYVSRLRSEISTAVTVETLDEINAQIAAYTGGDVLNEDQSLTLETLIGKKREELAKVKANGQLV